VDLSEALLHQLLQLVVVMPGDNIE